MPVDTPRADYVTALKRWKRCRDVFEGGEAVKAAGTEYLPKLSPTQPDDKYDAYKTRAMFYGATGRTVNGLTGVAFQREPTVNAPESVKPHLADITLKGEPFVGFAMRLIQEVLNPGRYGVLVDFHASTDPAKARPYWVAYAAEQIINWETSLVNGDTITTLVVLKEQLEQRAADGFGIETVDQYRVCDLVPMGERTVYRCRIFRKSNDEKKEWTSTGDTFPTRRGERLDFIPFVFFGPEGITSTIAKPPLLDLVDVNLSHYRSSADYEHGLHFTGLPQPVVSGSKPTDLHIGSSKAWVLPEPEAKAYYMEFTGEGLGALEKALTRKEELMARLGGRLLEGRSTNREAAETVKMRHAGDSASLQFIVGAASLGLTNLLRWHVWWTGQELPDDQVSAVLNSDFFSTDLSAEDVKALMLEYQAGGCSFETLFWKLQTGGWQRPGVDVETERKAIAEDADSLPEPEPEPAPAPEPGE